ncbi:MBL fold metallo-hydrolase [Candidatus Acetothermia bacterium]|nr:MBL fold metallo-hydrolase [Candidatus Acetothermia bacterium]
MRLTVLGTGCPIPDPQRTQSGYLLEKSGKLMLIDCGSGVLAQLARLGVDWEHLDTFLITHHHLDHLSDLLPLFTARWLMGFPRATVYGPAGTQEFISQMMAPFSYVKDHVSLQVQEIKAGAVHSIAGFEVSAFTMRHFVTSLAYKFDRTLVICGDSEPLPELREFVQDCKLVLHECSLPNGYQAPGHTTPTALGQALAGAKIDWLLLTHFYPEAATRIPEMLDAVRKHFHGRVSAATELQSIEL